MITDVNLQVRDFVSIKVSKIKVLLLYIVYPFAIGSYFKKALEHRDDVDLRVAGPYTSNWMPWLGGMTVPMKYAVPPHVPLPFPPDIREVNYESVKAQLGDWIPDIIINVDANLHWKYRPSDGYVVTVGTDPHVLNDFYDVPRAYSDKFFNMQLCYSKGRDFYLPYAYSQYDHYPIDGTIGTPPNDKDWKNPPESVEYVQKDVDAVLIGMPYENRVQWVNELRKRGVSLIFENGPIFDEARALYNRGRIGLNWSSMNDLNARCFELPAMKLYPVVNNVPDLFLHEYFHSHAIFSNMNEAIEKVVWAKEHPEDTQRNAVAAYELIQGQTHDARVQTILEESGFV